MAGCGICRCRGSAGQACVGLIRLPDGRDIAYLRLFSFAVGDLAACCHEMAGMLQLLPQTELIVDVRANPGGTIPAGEALLHLLGPCPVENTRNVFRATEQMRAFSDRIEVFSRWRRSLGMVYGTGLTFSLACRLKG